MGTSVGETSADRTVVMNNMQVVITGAIREVKSDWNIKGDVSREQTLL